LSARRPPDLDELVGSDLEPGERDRLQRVHDLLVAAGPPPELPPELAAPSESGAVVPFRRPSRRRLAVAAILAAAVAAAAFGAGYLLGGDGDDASAEPRWVVELAGGDARASLSVFEPDDSGNWPMRMTAQGLEEDETYELWLTRDGELVRLCGSFAAGDERTVVEMNAPWRLTNFDGWVVTRAGDERPVLREATPS
jgi:Anti-sigma-K factor rskA